MSVVSQFRSSPAIREIVQLRRALDAAQLQLGTGKRAQSYAELGGGRAPSLEARAKLANYEGYGQTITQLNLRLDVVQTSLTRMGKIVGEQRGANTDTMFAPVDGRQTAAQKASFARLQEMVGLLNQEVDGRRLFSGRRTDGPASVSAETIVNGSPPRAGLKTVIAERVRADRGADGLGRLAVASPVPGTVTLSDTASGPFGFKVQGITSSLTNGAVAQDLTGPPPNLSVSFTGVPRVGDLVDVALTAPDGTTTTMTLRAVDRAAGEGEFRLGTDAATTAANFRTALEDELRRTVARDLMPASVQAAATAFFDIDAARPPQRVDVVTTPEAATALRPATATDTVRWYTGDDAVDDARATSAARVDTSVTVGYGMRATETGIRRVVTQLAAFAAVDFDTNDPNAHAAYAELAGNVRERLAEKTGSSVETIQSEMAVVQQQLKAADDRQKSTRAMMNDLLSEIEGIDEEEVATRILEMQTRLEASYRTTSMIQRMSLVNFMG